MDSLKTSPKQAAKRQAGEGGRPRRRRFVKEMLERGRRLRNRAGMLIGLSMGVAALLTTME